MFRRLGRALKRLKPSAPAAASASSLASSPTTTAADLAPADGAAAEASAEPAPAVPELILTVNDRRYNLRTLPQETQQLVADLQRADELIALRQETLDLLRSGRSRLRRQLGDGLARLAPQGNPQPSAWSARLSQD